jgi:hypothetical protein
MYWKSSSFLTLTYNNDNVNSTDGVNSLCKSDLQKYFKRIRRDLELQDRNIKYFACGEYGPETQRPHYHAIVFGLDRIKDKLLIEQNWPFGFVTIGTVTYESCRYTAQYIQKKVLGIEAEDEYKDREPPFQLQSQGLGLKYALDYLEMYKGKLTVDGKIFSIPRYFRDKTGIEIPQEYYDKKMKSTDESLLEHGFTLDDYEKNELKKRSQAARNLAAKFNRDKPKKL